MAARISKPKKIEVVKGSHSVRTVYSDGTVDFTVDWKKLEQQVSQAIKEYETAPVTVEKKKSTRNKKDK